MVTRVSKANREGGNRPTASTAPRPSGLPANWPPGVTYLTTPYYFGISPQQRKLLQTQPADIPGAPASTPPLPEIPSILRFGPSAAVEIRTITDPTHPAYGQRGLFAARHLPANSFILPYLGVYHRGSVSVGGGGTNIHNKRESDYDLWLDRDADVAIDADWRGNEARFANDYRGTGKPRANAEFRQVWDPRRGERGMAIFVRLPPTNWRSYFSGSTWEWDEHTQEYYLHLFARQMPDINWENEDARRAVYDSSMKFWLDMGVDGFRIDCVNMYSKHQQYRDAPIVNPKVYEQPGWSEYANGPRMHEFLREMNEKVLNNYDTMTVGELPHTPDPEHVLRYVGANDKQMSMVFQFDIVDIGQGTSYKYRLREWKLPVFKATVAKWQQFIEGTDGWTTAFCENHDQGRSVTRFASDAPEHRVHSAKLLALLFASLTGTLFIYQGQEIGMINMPPEWSIDADYKDIESVSYYHSACRIARETLDDPAEIKKEIDYVGRSIRVLGRDNARTPMQWDDSNKSAGFTDAPDKAWMRTHDLYPEINVARQQTEPDSPLNFWKRMLVFRKKHADLFIYGNFRVFDMDNESTFVFAKTTAAAGESGAATAGKTAMVVLNFTSTEQVVDLPAADDVGILKFEVGNYTDVAAVEEEQASAGRQRKLRPWEGRLYMSV